MRWRPFPIEEAPACLEVPASWDDYIDARIQYWVDAEKRHVDRDPFMRLIASYLRSNRPPPVPLGLVHGDFQVANVLVGATGATCSSTGSWPTSATRARTSAGADGQRHANRPTSSGPTRRRSTPATASSAGSRGAGQPGHDRLLPAPRLVDGVRQRDRAAGGAGERRGHRHPVAYMSPAVAGMHDVFMRALKRHAAATGGAK